MKDTTASFSLPQRLQTGISGLDQILRGGLFQGSVYLVTGAPGSGKTILANQCAFNHVAGGGRAVYVTLLAESHARMLMNLHTFQFFVPTAVGSDLLYFNGLTHLEQGGRDGLFTFLRDALRTEKPSLLVIDGLGSVEYLMPSSHEIQRLIQQLQTLAEVTGCTMLLLSSNPSMGAQHAEATMVDGLIECSKQRVGPRIIRHVEVHKLRASPFIEGHHVYTITGDGVVVYPRLESDEGLHVEMPPARSKHFSTGVAELDSLIDGGLAFHTTTLLYGVAGSGKTVLSLPFLAAGAALGEPGLHLSFDERPVDLLAKAEAIGVPLAGAVEQGLVTLRWEPPTEVQADIFVARVLELVARDKVQRLVVDGLNTLHRSIDPVRRTAFYGALINRLRNAGVTTVFTMEMPQLVGPTVDSPLDGHSDVMDNLILIRQVELHSQLYRLLSIIKLRHQSHANEIREFRITNKGIVLASTFASAEAILTGVARPHGPLNPTGVPAEEVKGEREGKARGRRG